MAAAWQRSILKGPGCERIKWSKSRGTLDPRSKKKGIRQNWELGKKEKRKEEQEEEYIFRIRPGKNVCVAKQEEFKRIVKSSPNNFQRMVNKIIKNY